MYLFSLCNYDLRNILVFTKNVNIFTLELLWGQTNVNETEEDSFEFVVELKNNESRKKKYIKYEEFKKNIHETIEPFLYTFLLTIQNQSYIQVVYESQDTNSLISCFRLFSFDDSKEIGNTSRQGIESERSITQFIFGCPNHIFFENVNVASNAWKPTVEKNKINLNKLNELNKNSKTMEKNFLSLSDKIYQDTRKSVKDFNCFPPCSSTTFLNLDDGSISFHSNFTKLQQKGSLILYEKMGDMQNLMLDVFCKLDTNCKKTNSMESVSFTKCIVCSQTKIEDWKKILKDASNFSILFLETFQDFDKITFSFLKLEKSLVVCTIDFIRNFMEEMNQILEDTRVGLECIVEQNSFVSIKSIPFENKVGISLKQAKKIFWNQENKFPLKSVPLQWVLFDALIFDISDETCITKYNVQCISEENLFIFDTLHAKWNFVCLPIEGQAFTKNTSNYILNPSFFSHVPSHVFVNNESWNEKKQDSFLIQLWNFYFLCDCTTVIPVSMKISQRILPVQFYMHMHEEEKHCLESIDQIYEFLNKKSNGFLIPNMNKIQTKDLLIPCEKNNFPVNIFKLMERNKSVFTPTFAVDNVYNQTWRDKNIMQGNTLVDIFANWKFDKSISSQTKYKSVFENVQEEQPHCYICFENEPMKFSVCGHGFCMECWEEYKKTELKNMGLRGEEIERADINFIFTCPICRKELCLYDWIQVGSLNNIQTKIPSKLEKLKDQIELQQNTQKKILIIVPQHTKNIFLEYLIENFPSFAFLDLSDCESTLVEQWICVEEETSFSFLSTEFSFDIVYYISPTFVGFKSCYAFLLFQVMNKEFLMVMLCISNHSQEESQLLSIIETFFSF